MKKSETRKTEKKTYKKPLLRVVNISGGVQTLAVGCKFSFGTAQAPGSAPCTLVPCTAPGS